jgi:CRISPR/Cas system-associated exonuclease Cas4 (RecB family)
VQREGFNRWRAGLDTSKADFNLHKKPFPASGHGYDLVNEGVTKKQRSSGLKKVSATDMTNFFKCPSLCFFQNILGLREFSLEARLLDETSLGNLYHEILKNLFSRIREEDKIFRIGRLADYRSWAHSFTVEAVRGHPAFQGPLAVPLLVSQSAGMAKKIGAALKAFAAYFAGTSIGTAELSLELAEEGRMLKGKLDQVFVWEDRPCIVDYKTGNFPAAANCIEAEDSPLEDFQIPMYIKLYEERLRPENGPAVRVEGAFFMSINKHDIGAVVGSPGRKRGLSREEYQPTLDALETYIEQFVRAVEDLDFSLKRIRFKDCLNCHYRNICRTTYSLNRGADL